MGTLEANPNPKMKLLCCLVALSIVIVRVQSKDVSENTQYLDHRGTKCTTTGLSFKLNTAPARSDLAAETGLNVTVYAINAPRPPYPIEQDPSTTVYKLDYKSINLKATRVYAGNQLPVAYIVNQPFLAVPMPGSGSGRNYTFNVSCSVQASFEKKDEFDTIINGQGDGDSGVVKVADHLDWKLEGIKGGKAAVGSPLTFVMALNDDTYSALIPTNCQYFNPADPYSKTVSIVSNRCPIDPENGYLGKIYRNSSTRYELHFKAFSLDNKPNSRLGIACEIHLCVEGDNGDCYEPCWGPDPTTTTTQPKTTTTGVITTISTDGETSGTTVLVTTGPSSTLAPGGSTVGSTATSSGSSTAEPADQTSGSPSVGADTTTDGATTSATAGSTTVTQPASPSPTSTDNQSSMTSAGTTTAASQGTTTAASQGTTTASGSTAVPASDEPARNQASFGSFRWKRSVSDDDSEEEPRIAENETPVPTTFHQAYTFAVTGTDDVEVTCPQNETLLITLYAGMAILGAFALLLLFAVIYLVRVTANRKAYPNMQA